MSKIPKRMNLLPKELNYLEPVAKELAKIPPDDLNEDIDATKLETALRNRVNGLELRDAISQLTNDNKILQEWIKETKTSEGAVFFIGAYLMRPGPLARQLLAPPPESTVSIQTAPDWRPKEFPRRLDLFKEKVFCTISILDKLGFDIHKRKSDHRQELQKSQENPWAKLGVWTKISVQFGECHGEKSVYVQPGKKNCKSVDYLLQVPGGFVSARLGHEKRNDFDELEFEQKLHTLKIIPPPSSASYP